MSKTISSKELYKKIKIGSNARMTLKSRGFPKYECIEGELMFPIKEVCKFFNVQNLDEPFITIKQAARILKKKLSQVSYLARKNKIPNYRLKSSRGSQYLFRKSDLELFLKNDVDIISPDVDYVNKRLGSFRLISYLRLFTNVLVDKNLTELQISFLSEYFFGGKDYNEISNSLNTDRKEIECSYYTVMKKLKFLIDGFGKFGTYEDIVNENIELKNKISLLNGTTNENKKFIEKDKQSTESEFIFYINKKLDGELNTFGFTERSRNALGLLDYDAIKISFEDFGIKPEMLMRLPNLGDKSYDEIIIKVKKYHTLKFDNINIRDVFENGTYKNVRDTLIDTYGILKLK